MKFELSDKEIKRANKFIKKQEKKYPTIPTAMGGRFNYIFTPTGIGTGVSIRDAQENIEKNITDYDLW